MKSSLRLVVSLFLLLSLSLVAAPAINNPDLPIVQPIAVGTGQNASTSNSSIYWLTSDYGPLNAVSQIAHSALTASTLLWSNAGHTMDTDLDMGSNDITNVDSVWASHINATTGNFTDLYVSNSTLHVGNISISSSDGILQIEEGKELNVTAITAGTVDASLISGSVNATNITADNINASTLAGDGSGIYNLDLTNITIAGGNISAINFNGSTFTGNNFFGNNFTGGKFWGSDFFGGDFFGWFNWTTSVPWLIFNGYNLALNETEFNNTIQDLAGVKLEITNVILTASGGLASATSPVLDFTLKQIIIVPSAPTDKYRFEAVGAISGAIIDKDRALHTGAWSILKDIPINEAVNISITNANPDSSYNVTFKYLSQDF